MIYEEKNINCILVHNMNTCKIPVDILYLKD